MATISSVELDGAGLSLINASTFLQSAKENSGDLSKPLVFFQPSGRFAAGKLVEIVHSILLKIDKDEKTISKCTIYCIPAAYFLCSYEFG